VILVKVLSLPPTVAAALVMLSLAPVPPLLPKKQLKAGGRHSYAVGLLAAAALVSIFWLPIAVKLAGAAFNLELREPIMAIGAIMLFTVLAPLAVGFAFRSLAPAAADKVQPFAAGAGVVLLLLAVAPILITQWPKIAAEVGDGTLLAFSIFIVVGLVVGHLLGGPGQEDRTVLAIASASHHPGVALQLANLNFPNEPSVAPAVLLYLLTVAVLTTPYVLWRKRLIPDTTGSSPQSGA
jgi:BASS family bile acid:Na+ symporter